MALSRQDASRKTGRTNQKTRTRAALLRAAGELVQEGRPPSMPEAAERALVSVATAYRYFSTAEDLWWEASSIVIQQMEADIDAGIESVGEDPQARLEVLIRSVSFRMLDDQMIFRTIAMRAQEQWFRQADTPDDKRVPVRQGRRNTEIRTAIAPLRDQLPDPEVERIAHALGVVIGTEAVIALTDAVGLDRATAEATLLDAGRWLLAGALAEMSGSGD